MLVTDYILYRLSQILPCARSAISLVWSHTSCGIGHLFNDIR